MKKALVLAIVCALGLGFAGFAGSPLSGSWATDICFNPLGANVDLNVKTFQSVLELDYTVGGWIFGMTMILDSGGFDNLFFDATGNLGAFSISSFLDFDPNPSLPRFVKWENAAQVSIAGVQFYGLMGVKNLSITQTPAITTGWALGAIGTAGDLKVGAEVDFNLGSQLSNMWSKGWGYVTGWTSYDCLGWSKGMFTYVQTNTCVCWTNFDLWLQFPFTCFTVLAKLNFDPTNGFDYFKVELNDIDVGIPWLLLDDFDITFQVASKTIFIDWQLVYTGVCFTPYLSLAFDTLTPTTITGIEFNALMLSYTWNGVTFKAGDILDATWGGYTWAFDATGELTIASPAGYGCPIDVTYDEFFGIEVDGDSCCGGAFSAGVYNFFNVGAAGGIFDWQETLVNLEFGIASNLDIRVSLAVNTTSISSLCIGFTFTW